MMCRQVPNWSPPWPWADTQPIAVLSIPELGIRQLVLDGDSGRNLAFGPVLRGGLSTRDLVISGHRDTHFTFVRDLNFGDQISIETTYGNEHSKWRFRN